MRSASLLLLPLAAAMAACSRAPPARPPSASAEAPAAAVAESAVSMRGPGRHGMGMMGMGRRMGMMRHGGIHGAGGAPPDSAAAAPPAHCPTPTPAMVSEGETVFARAGQCVACHGPRGAGTMMAPPLGDAEWLNVDGSYPAVARVVGTGVPAPKRLGGAMPPRGGAPLTDADVCAVAAYVVSLRR